MLTPKDNRCTILPLGSDAHWKGRHGVRPPRFTTRNGTWSAPSRVSASRVSCGFSDTAHEHLAREAAEAVHAGPDVHAVCADVHALDQQRHDARLLGGQEFVPQRVEVLQGGET